MIYLVTGLIIMSVLVDQVLKWIVCNTLEIGQSVPLIDGVFHFTYIRNFGAAFSILQNRLSFLILVTVLITAVLLVFLYRTRKTANKLMLISIPLIIGGGIGNLIDRIRLGYVVDFLDFCLIHFPVFNFADCCVTIGAALLVLGFLLKSPAERRYFHPLMLLPIPLNVWQLTLYLPYGGKANSIFQVTACTAIACSALQSLCWWYFKNRKAKTPIFAIASLLFVCFEF
ncbi:MAG: signal peptidase II, partial [Firmicutes bacterium]|nr:signal peptidase II [Bacillota bacterium]